MFAGKRRPVGYGGNDPNTTVTKWFHGTGFFLDTLDTDAQKEMGAHFSPLNPNNWFRSMDNVTSPATALNFAKISSFNKPLGYTLVRDQFDEQRVVTAVITIKIVQEFTDRWDSSPVGGTLAYNESQSMRPMGVALYIVDDETDDYKEFPEMMNGQGYMIRPHRNKVYREFNTHGSGTNYLHTHRGVLVQEMAYTIDTKKYIPDKDDWDMQWMTTAGSPTPPKQPLLRLAWFWYDKRSSTPTSPNDLVKCPNAQNVLAMEVNYDVRIQFRGRKSIAWVADDP